MNLDIGTRKLCGKHGNLNIGMGSLQHSVDDDAITIGHVALDSQSVVVDGDAVTIDHVALVVGDPDTQNVR